MKTKTFFVLTAAGFLFTSAPVIGKDKGKGHKDDAASPAADAKGKSAAPATANANDQKEPWVNVNVTFGNAEKEQIREYVRNCETPRKGKKNKGLPPGLAKKSRAAAKFRPDGRKNVCAAKFFPNQSSKSRIHCRTN
jgi:hypothetical protein